MNSALLKLQGFRKVSNGDLNTTYSQLAGILAV
jgi:hypothetical protein